LSVENVVPEGKVKVIPSLAILLILVAVNVFVPHVTVTKSPVLKVFVSAASKVITTPLI